MDLAGGGAVGGIVEDPGDRRVRVSGTAVPITPPLG